MYSAETGWIMLSTSAEYTTGREFPSCGCIAAVTEIDVRARTAASLRTDQDFIVGRLTVDYGSVRPAMVSPRMWVVEQHTWYSASPRPCSHESEERMKTLIGAAVLVLVTTMAF